MIVAGGIAWVGAWIGEVPFAEVVVNDAWSEGMGSSLRTGLAALDSAADVDAVIVKQTVQGAPGECAVRAPAPEGQAHHGATRRGGGFAAGCGGHVPV